MPHARHENCGRFGFSLRAADIRRPGLRVSRKGVPASYSRISVSIDFARLRWFCRVARSRAACAVSSGPLRTARPRRPRRSRVSSTKAWWPPESPFARRAISTASAPLRATPPGRSPAARPNCLPRPRRRAWSPSPFDSVLSRAANRPFSSQHSVKILLGLGKVRPDCQRLAILLHGFVKPAPSGQGDAKIVVQVKALSGSMSNALWNCVIASSNLCCEPRAMPRLMWALAKSGLILSAFGYSAMASSTRPRTNRT